MSEITALEKQGEQKLLAVLSRNRQVINSILPSGLDEKRFGWLVVNSIRQNPALLNVTPASFLNCVVLASQMGLEIRKDSAYLVPFGTECQLLVDYKGKLDLARRSGKVGGIQAVIIRAKDKFRWHYGPNGVEFAHEPDWFGDRGDIIGVYAFAQLSGGFTQFKDPMSLAQIDAIRKMSKKGVGHRDLAWCLSGAARELPFNHKERTPWSTNCEQMILKTCLHQLMKATPLTPEQQLSQDVDEAFETGATVDAISQVCDLTEEDHRPIAEAHTWSDWKGGAREEVAKRRVAEVSETPDWVEGKPRAATISEIRKEEARLTTAKWKAILGEHGYEDLSQIPNEGVARKIREAMQQS